MYSAAPKQRSAAAASGSKKLKLTLYPICPAERQIIPRKGLFWRLSLPVLRTNTIITVCARANGRQMKRRRIYRIRKILWQQCNIVRLRERLADYWRPNRENSFNNSSFSFILNTDENRLIVPSLLSDSLLRLPPVHCHHPLPPFAYFARPSQYSVLFRVAAAATTWNSLSFSIRSS